MRMLKEYASLRRLVMPAILSGFVGLCAAQTAASREAPSSGGSAAVTGSIFRDCASICPEMVVIGPGSFQMGSTEADEAGEKIFSLGRTYPTPHHLVTIGYRFVVGKYDVTRTEYAAFVREAGYHSAADCTGYATRSEHFGQGVSGLDWRNPGFPQTDRDPVVCINWDDIKAYLAWLKGKTHQHYRLLSEAEWEYAARAGTSTSRYWGNGIAQACRYANVEDQSYLRAKGIPPGAADHFDCTDGYVYTSPVGSFRPNGLGLYDMLGDVEQLVEDCWNYNYSGAPSDGAAWLTGDCTPHVLRGGSFRSPPGLVRNVYRDSLPGFIRSDSVGFRVARTL